MNLIDGYVTKVLNYEIKNSSDCWELEPGEEDKEHHIYTVEYVDEGGTHQTTLWYSEPNTDVVPGFRFAH